MKYFSRAFDVVTFEQAKATVLTPDPNQPYKFQMETDYLINKLDQAQLCNTNSTVLDFGCGMGRVSKALIEKFNCKVLGMDISESMKIFATLYVTQPKLFACVDSFPDANSIDLALAILVLQHTEDPAKEIQGIFTALKPQAHLILVNEHARLVPVGADVNGYVMWNDDAFDVRAEILKYADLVNSWPYINSDKNIEVYRKR